MMAVKREFTGFAKPLQVVGYIGTRKGDAVRGPMVRLRPEDALIRLLMPGELVRVVSDRRSELAELEVDESVPKGGAILRDVAGAAVSEIIRVVRIDTETPRPI
ncbi:MAG: hypothetical protein H7Z40_07710 [Phycisphaerae bacterium]|nr:hypothetical protein [Gemmatimonadaceae bacterium]